MLAGLDRYSASAAKEVLRATAYLAQAASEEILPYRNRLGEESLPTTRVAGCNSFNVKTCAGSMCNSTQRLDAEVNGYYCVICFW